MFILHSALNAALIALALLTLTAGGCAARASVAPDRLACEFRTDPQGIATPTPRLSWRLNATDPSHRGASQSAYRVVAAATSTALNNGSPLLWDTGIVRTTNPSEPLSTRVEYAGPPLASRDSAWWKVRVWDQDGRDSGWSTPATFSLGLLKQSDWKAAWIGLDDAPAAPLTAEIRDELRRRPWIRLPGGPARNERVAYFRSEFELPSASIKEAWLAGTADMLADIHINGVSLGQLARWELLRPIDVSRALTPGRNAIGFRVENHDGLNPAVSGTLFIRFADGNEQRVQLDKSWKLAESAADGWDRAGFDESTWTQVEESPGQPWGGSRNTEHFMPRTPYLRTTFTTAGKPIRRATLYATALGVYECRLNGKRIGDAEFAPGWTEYSKRVEHQTYDVTGLITPGDNCLGAVLGDGWYAGLMGYTGRRRFYGGPARFMSQLEIEYSDGSRETIATGPAWRAFFGPILYTDNYMGSAYDSRLEIPGWDTPRFDAAAWRPVEVGLAQTPSQRRQADVTEKIRAAVSNGRVSLLVGPAALGDPAFGVVKALTVEYTIGEKNATVTLPEGQTLALPRPGESGSLAITKAVFAEPPAPPLPPFVIEPQRSEPVRRFEELPALTITQPRPGCFVFDLGQNMVGWARLKVTGVRGQRLVVRHAEMLNPDGTLYTSNLRGATATDFFTLKGGEEILEPPFTFHGFRYVEITGLPASARPEPSMVTGIVAHSALTPAGSFTCSNPLVNRLVHNIVWGQKGNYFEVPTDCPQRDERLGWTGDAQFFVNTAAYTFDIASFMSRWLKTLNKDAQFEDGTFAHVAPKVRERGGSTAWGDAAIVCTHAMYLTYADTRVISDNYNAMCRYMAWLDSRTTDGIAKVGGFGDWLNLGDPTSPDLIDTAYRAELCRLMRDMAAAINRPADSARFDAAREATIRAFLARFLAPDGSLNESGQTGYALAFTMDLLPREIAEKAAAHFEAAITKRNSHLATGFIGTPRLLPGLFAANKPALAAQLLLNEDYPSWLYQVKLGATTMWERWDGWTPDRGFSDVGMNSFNHYAFGAVGDYLYRHVAGIAPLAPGYSRVLVAPTLTPGLDHAAATYDSIAGTIASAWRRTPQGAQFDITIPPNTTAEIRLPLGSAPPESVTESHRPLKLAPGLSILPDPTNPHTLRLNAASGTYHFTVPTR
ncbi:Alpha-L-rhamnosidase [Phycisphaerales bacterium]|nr:Alpha-L-rhamnosidase [Phycisphaerales bacterium]